MNNKKVSLMTGPPCFLLQTILFFLSILSFYYWICDFNASVFKTFLKLLDIFFVFLVLFEVLPLYSSFDSSQWLREDNQRIIDEMIDFSDKLVCFKRLRHFPLHFLPNFWFLHVFLVDFTVLRFIAMSYWLLMPDKHPCTPIKS